ncbi:hypothetical protein L6252_02905 [Candidatus Parcubacteria bacterium]|nr:hypothetical protein [Candidatus Parcubacteria bacterium]
MKTNLVILIIALVAIVVVGGIYLYTQKPTTLEEGNELDDFGDENEDPVACAQDALQCPDGSYVSRTGPNCEFAECPSGDCVLEGERISGVESIAGKVCCADLSLLNDSSNEDLGGCITGFGSVESAKFICTYCGNGVCGLGENKCNCPEDCTE